MPPNLITLLPVVRCAGWRFSEGMESLGKGLLQVPLEINLFLGGP
jgi:hypothetical protein